MPGCQCLSVLITSRTQACMVVACCGRPERVSHHVARSSTQQQGKLVTEQSQDGGQRNTGKCNTMMDDHTVRLESI
ncbi:hypothetical protein BXZ70DRAFT_527369 [Cristinia sonorae]|uniref:Secreted protein n=1 Tax=Cristinia sonorae TaxID=1940300 RepID=A0A8K0XTP3_9AGAR|nr:hypothetical protein BXZ70DRAFT_527369 [Cristinia sonorae]